MDGSGVPDLQLCSHQAPDPSMSSYCGVELEVRSRKNSKTVKKTPILNFLSVLGVGRAVREEKLHCSVEPFYILCFIITRGLVFGGGELISQRLSKLQLLSLSKNYVLEHLLFKGHRR